MNTKRKAKPAEYFAEQASVSLPPGWREKLDLIARRRASNRSQIIKDLLLKEYPELMTGVP